MTRQAPTTATQKRRAAALRGRFAEQIAAMWLRLKGYRILGRNVRTPVGEIDLLARSGTILVVCEVKHRKTFEQAAGAITARQRQRLERAAEYVLARPNAKTRGIDGLRFDLIAIVKGRLPQHIRNAWRS